MNERKDDEQEVTTMRSRVMPRALAGVVVLTALLGGLVGAIGVAAGDTSSEPVLHTGGGVVFNFIEVGETSQPKFAVLSNAGGGVLTITGVHIVLGGEDFTIPANGDKCTGQQLGAGQSCEIEVLFHPTAEGTRVGSIAIEDSRDVCRNYVFLAGSGSKASEPAVAHTADCAGELGNVGPTTTVVKTTESLSTTTTSTPAADPPHSPAPATQAAGLTSVAKCLSRRLLEVFLKTNDAEAITKARLYIDGHLANTARGGHLSAIRGRLARVSRMRHSLRVVVTTAHGTMLATRPHLYLTCTRVR
jgi:hypothetical protein